MPTGLKEAMLRMGPPKPGESLFLLLDGDDIRRTHDLAERYGWNRDDEDDGSAPIFASLLYG